MCDRTGGALIANLSDEISEDAPSRGIDATLLSAIIRHEDGARERRVFGPFANLAEKVEAWKREDSGLASIGIGQMQVRRAQELEDPGYISKQSGYWGTVNALLDPKTAVNYIGAMVQYLNDQLITAYGYSFRVLSSDSQQRIILMGIIKDGKGKLGLRV